MTIQSPLPLSQQRSLWISLSLASLLFLIYYTTTSSGTLSASRLPHWTSSSSSDSALKHKSDPSIPSPPSLVQSYRQRLSLSEPFLHSPTLTFDHIYVLSLPSRQDRRDEIKLLASALEIEVIFVDAVFKEEGFLKWIAERVVEVRDERLRLMSKERGVKSSSIGGLHVGNPWLDRSIDTEGKVSFPLLTDARFPPTGSWIDTLEHAFSSGTLDTLVPSDPDLKISEVLHDPMERVKGRQVNEGVLSTYWGHTRAIKMMLQNGDKSALILEDDVDFEWDLERMWRRVERKLPRNWESVHLGHCWGKELLKPAYLHPNLHQSTSPLCLHAYALSSSGATSLLSLLSNPWTAYQTAIDTAVPTFITQGALNQSFSIEPPLVIQRKTGKSDIQNGKGSRWRGLLGDSTWDRIRRERGEDVELEDWKDGLTERERDPATVFRYRGRCP